MRSPTVLAALVVLGSLVSASFPAPAGDAGRASSAGGIDLPVRFINVSEAVGLTGIASAQNWAWGDYDNDGYEDLLMLGTYLYRNNGPPRWDFTNVTERAGIYNTTKLWACWGDYDNDGWLDFFGGDINDPSVDHLWHNNGDGTFTDVTEAAGHVTDVYPSHAPSWGDYDLDGYLDLYVCNWATNQTIYYPDRMWHNNGDGTFSDATVASGADETANPAGNMGSCWGDYNNDGWPDLYVGCYFLRANYLYENRGGKFVNVAAEKGVEGHATRRLGTDYYGHSPGGAFVDLDNDLNLDIYCSNNAHRDYYRAGICDSSYFFHNNGPTMGYNFTDIFESCGVPFYPPGGNEELYFGENFADWDNDGDLDMFLPLVHDDIDYAYSYMMRNNGNNTFTDVSNETGLRVWNTVASAFCDYDQDGDVDMIAEGKVPYQNGTYAHRLFQNQGNSNHWIGFRLTGTRINSEAIGARITITLSDGSRQMREVQSQSGTHSQGNSLVQHFGVGDYAGKVDAVIRWSPWRTQTLTGLELGKVHHITEPGRSADIAVLGIEVPASLESGATGQFQVSLKNVGDEIANSFIVRLRYASADGSVVDEARLAESLAPGATRTVPLSWSPSREGEQALYATVEAVHPRDPTIANNEYRCTVNVVKARPPNLGPSITSFTVSKTELLPGETALLEAQASDPENDPLSYEFFCSAGTLEPQGASARWRAPPSPGTVTLQVAVCDGHDHTARKSLTVLVKEPPAPPVQPPANYPPRITSFRSEPAEPKNDGKSLLRLTVEASDDNGASDIARARFKLSDLGGPSTEVNSSGNGTFVLEYLIPKGTPPGAWTVSVEVFDRMGLSAKRSITVGVANAPKEPAPSSGRNLLPGPGAGLLALALAGALLLRKRRSWQVDK
jgi:hypothetical protein